MFVFTPFSFCRENCKLYLGKHNHEDMCDLTNVKQGGSELGAASLYF